MSRASLLSVYEDSEYGALTVEPPPTPLPRLQILVISIVLFSEPLTSTILFPFIYFMIKDFHLSDDEKEIGAYAGWITSVFFLAQFSTAVVWGRISDNHGRRPVLLIGLIGNSISACLFGLSKNLWWAIGARAFCGIVNGNSGVARSMVSEITDSTNRAKAFSIFGFCWGIGMIGGYLSRPVEGFPEYFGNSEFLKEYPYFLPCFVSSIGSFIGYLIGYIYLEESNPKIIAKQNEAALLKNKETEQTSEDDRSTAQPQDKPITSVWKSITWTSFLVILAYSLFGFHSMVFDEILPLYFLAPTYAGGLGSTSPEFAKALSILGIQQIFCQFIVYPRLSRSFTTLTLTRIALVLFIFVYFLFPELSTFKDWIDVSIESEVRRLWVFRTGYMSLLFIRYIGNCLAFTSLMIMVSNSAAPEVLGTVNG
ncbi:major facilitator superfamily domain-containing protein [Phycomyces nitens]|nr:major facilitator superfamily domain-containing protein [Phycomyces nitens]